jgi:hypothetical protein
MTSRIDTHQHIVPPQYRQWLAGQGIEPGGIPVPDWDSRSAIAMMDGMGIAAGVLSVSTPGVHLTGDDPGPAPAARDWARRVNEFAAETVKDHQRSAPRHRQRQRAAPLSPLRRPTDARQQGDAGRAYLPSASRETGAHSAQVSRRCW